MSLHDSAIWDNLIAHAIKEPTKINRMKSNPFVRKSAAGPMQAYKQGSPWGGFNKTRPVPMKKGGNKPQK